MGVRCHKNNSTSVFFRSVASEKMSNRSKNGSLDSENEYFLARAPKRSVTEVDFRYYVDIYKANYVDLLRETCTFDSRSTSEASHFGTRDKQWSFSESNEPILEFLDIFSDATDTTNTLVTLFLRHLHSIIDSERCPDFESAVRIFL